MNSFDTRRSSSHLVCSKKTGSRSIAVYSNRANGWSPFRLVTTPDTISISIVPKVWISHWILGCRSAKWPRPVAVWRTRWWSTSTRSGEHNPSSVSCVPWDNRPRYLNMIIICFLQTWVPYTRSVQRQLMKPGSCIVPSKAWRPFLPAVGNW